MKTLAVIPARGGSKGVPRKNIRLLCGKPLLTYTADAALASRRLTHVVLSTEDEEIAEVGRRCGLDVPFIRPSELAQDNTPMLAVMQHALLFLEKNGENFDAVCILQPTNPLRQPGHIDACIRLLEEDAYDAVVTVLQVPYEYNPHWVYFKDPNGSLRLSTQESEPISRRQELPQAFHRDGSIYVTRCEVVMQQNSLYGRRLLGYQMDPQCSVNIDTPEDWRRAERLLHALAVS